MSWRPVFMPCAPAGLWMCAESPPMNTRSTFMQWIIRLLMWNQELQLMSRNLTGIGER